MEMVRLLFWSKYGRLLTSSSWGYTNYGCGDGSRERTSTKSILNNAFGMEHGVHFRPLIWWILCETSREYASTIRQQPVPHQIPLSPPQHSCQCSLHDRNNNRDTLPSCMSPHYPSITTKYFRKPLRRNAIKRITAANLANVSLLLLKLSSASA